MPEETKKTNSILAIFTKEYKYEGLLLLFLSIIAIVLGSMVLIGESSGGTKGLSINENVFLIGDYPKAFAWILIILGVMSLVLAVWPFFRPSIAEVKRVSWPTKGTLFQNTAIVFAFILIMSLFFLLADFLLGYLLQFFNWLAGKM
ncbi:MAG TPA: preprotein translocase subunit SecE [Bacilli bacterium]|nr:MAG: preprotein translocase subunit SecE [Tenericutes bacterium ADurb.BinA124]HNZ50959.1 preprotein translocase subunit SecE [Bacilli bacterium]HOH17855.1 preprotein translocase subunit SecE [Bacilli bacterium]HPN60770.1 preprotein translocase subunit SecE [Bacilli bacterium]HPX84099.1 preprotein translocase subunit SecE [Bacilli bacterium]